MIKEKVKDLGYERYKLVVQVTVGEKTGQGIRLASRCLWDTATDKYVSLSPVHRSSRFQLFINSLCACKFLNYIFPAFISHLTSFPCIQLRVGIL